MADAGQGMPIVPPVRPLTPSPAAAPAASPFGDPYADLKAQAAKPIPAAPVQVASAPVAPSVASGGFQGPTMTPQELVAAKQASTSQALSSLNANVLGDSGLAAQQAMHADYANGNTAGAIGDFARGTAIGATRLAAAPFVLAAGVGAHVYDAAADGVSRFAHGLFGTPAAAPAAPAQVATPVAPAGPVSTSSITAGMPVVGAAPGVINRPVAAGPRLVTTGPDGTTTVTPTAPAVGATAQASPVANAAGTVQTDWERHSGLPAGYQMQMIRQAAPRDRPGHHRGHERSGARRPAGRASRRPGGQRPQGIRRQPDPAPGRDRRCVQGQA